MCGRYALGIRASFVRHQLQQQGLPVHDAPQDDEVRETYNFPPGAYGLVYRADIPDNGVREQEDAGVNDIESADTTDPDEHIPTDTSSKQPKSYDYQLKAMKWGLIPFWTKRSPDYGSMLRTINCRDDSLIENRGMWNTMKQRKRCLVIAQGFFEWLKKGPGGKEKVPHFVKRKDGQLMCFAGLWDCVKYEDTEEKLYTYTIITTDSNKQLTFLHDRMPVILDPNTDAVKLWLDPTITKWSKDLQVLLKPYEGELECYPVTTEVGKVGNNSPDFIVPVDSKENKKNIANFFGNAKRQEVATEVQADKEEGRDTKDTERSEDNAPMPTPKTEHDGRKRSLSPDVDEHVAKTAKIEHEDSSKTTTPNKSSNKRRSAMKNEPVKVKTPVKNSESGAQRIEKFFGK